MDELYREREKERQKSKCKGDKDGQDAESLAVLQKGVVRGVGYSHGVQEGK